MCGQSQIQLFRLEVVLDVQHACDTCGIFYVKCPAAHRMGATSNLAFDEGQLSTF
jgi:hypothetical protein